jgi:ribulose-5-phosphate 4-epimerase/fuculose-1-phosphate aldolase
MQPNPTLDSDELPRSIAWHRAVYSVTAAKAVMLLVPPALLTLASRQDGRTRWDSMPLPFLREAAGGVMFLREPGIEAVTDAVNTNHVTVALGIGALTWGMDGYEVVARLHSAERAAEIALRAE